MHLVDSHCHLDFDPLGNTLDAVLARAAVNDVRNLLCISVTIEELPTVIGIAEAHPHIFASVGVHPNHREGHEPSVAELVALGQHPRVVAVGETGLDYFRSEGDLGWQHERFARHIEAARQLGKPLIIHTREAADDTLADIRTYGGEQPGGVIHCFTEDWRIATQALDLGYYISFSGIVTFKSATNIQDVARRMPLDRMLVETDSPYLAPVPHRGKTNEPAYVRHVAEYIATLRGVAVEEIAERTTENFFRLFRDAGANSFG
ncbi:MAG: TatD family hydrolase [Thiotrichales bacterium]